MSVAKVLKSKPISGVVAIGRTASLESLVRRLRDERIGAFVVVDDDNRLCGVISERDVVRALAEDTAGALSARVEQYMTRDVITASPSESAISVLERMTSGRFRHMPVLEDGELVGVVSIGDVVKYRIEMLQKDNQALEEFIRS